MAYVFVQLLPEISVGQAHFREAFEDGPLLTRIVEALVYSIALAGLAISYGLEKAALKAHEANSSTAWLRVATLSVYSLLLSYLAMAHQSAEGVTVIVSATALSFHLLVMNNALHTNFPDIFCARMRWVLAGAVLLGGVFGTFAVLPTAISFAIFGFVAGAMIYSILREEAPQLKNGSFRAFAVGAGTYAVVLVLFVQFPHGA